MRLTFLGTGASEGCPNPYCDCPNCLAGRTIGGKDIRRRSAALINDDLLIDLGPDVFNAVNAFGLDLLGLRFALQTHGDADHLDPQHVHAHAAAPWGAPNAPRLTWYASTSAIVRMNRLCGLPDGGLCIPEAIARNNLQPIPITPWAELRFGAYRVVPVPARHGPRRTCFLYAVEQRGRQLFYGTDTSVLPMQSWERLAATGWRFDLVVLDHTFGLSSRADTHMNAAQFAETMSAMRLVGVIKPGCRFFATHLFHRTNLTHEALVAYAAERGYEIAYDGLSLDN